MPRNNPPIPRPVQAAGFCQVSRGSQRGCGGSSGNPIGARPLSDASMGISVMATASEQASQNRFTNMNGPEKTWMVIHDRIKG